MLLALYVQEPLLHCVHIRSSKGGVAPLATSLPTVSIVSVPLEASISNIPIVPQLV